MDLAKRALKDGRPYFQTLEGHTTDSLMILKVYIEECSKSIDIFCRRWDIDKDLLLKNLFEMVALHDIGKLTREFQKNIKVGKSSSDFPHPLSSVQILINMTKYKILTPIKEYYRSEDLSLPEVVAILCHHTQPHNGIYDGYIEDAHVLEDKVNDFLHGINNIKRKISFNIKDDIEWDKVYIKGLNTFDFVNQRFKRYKLKWNKLLKALNESKPELKAYFSFIFSILQLCDDYSSANFTAYIENNINDESPSIFENVMSEEDALQYIFNFPHIEFEDIFRGHKPYAFQEQVYNLEADNQILFAPCGRGKTEAALAWAKSLSDRNRINRLIFALPTQITSNAMYERLTEIFGSENVGLYHSRSLSYYKDMMEDEDLKYQEIMKEKNFQSKVFLKPVMVTTIDHLVYSMIHGFSQADFTLGNVQTSGIVFDEVHYYEKDTLSHLIQIFRILNEMKIPHFLMSGTFPELILREIKDAIGNIPYKIVRDDEGLQFTPFLIKKENKCLIYKDKDEYKINEDFLRNIIDGYDSGLRQFIIVNTVRRAQEIYKRIREELPAGNIELYHSRYTGYDRKEKDKKILKNKKIRPYVLVSTQAAEISLDISSERLYTELAPADAIGQRGGRLNRGAFSFETEYGTAEMIVYDVYNFLPYATSQQNDMNYVILKTKDLLPQFGPISYYAIKEICDNAYNDVKLLFSELYSIFNECTLFGYNYKEIARNEENGLVFKFRSDNFATLDVVPYDVTGEDEEKIFDYDNIVKIPLWWLKANPDNFSIRERDRKKILVCFMRYDSDYGFDESSINEPGDEHGNID